MTDWRLTLSLLPELFAVCRLAASASLPVWARETQFISVTRTADELSIVCRQSDVPLEVQHLGGWRCLKVEGPFALDGAVGVVAALTVPLAAAQISVFIISTYDTDYLLLQDSALERAHAVLTQSGHQLRD